MLRQMTEFVQVHKIIMIVVTHISARSYDEEGGIRPFRIAQAHGSSHFGKMCDRGICVARTRMLQATSRLPEGERDRMIIRFDKAKDEESMGKIDTIAVRYDRNAMDIKPDHAATEEIASCGGSDHDPPAQHLPQQRAQVCRARLAYFPAG
jgi:hypothetical protein